MKLRQSLNINANVVKLFKIGFSRVNYFFNFPAYKCPFSAFSHQKPVWFPW